QLDEAAPNPVAITSERAESSGSSRRISPLATTACTAAESAKPRISAHRISQNIPKAKESASPRLVRTATSIDALYEQLRTRAGRPRRTASAGMTGAGRRAGTYDCRPTQP